MQTLRFVRPMVKIPARAKTYKEPRHPEGRGGSWMANAEGVRGYSSDNYWSRPYVFDNVKVNTLARTVSQVTVAEVRVSRGPARRDRQPVAWQWRRSDPEPVG